MFLRAMFHVLSISIFFVGCQGKPVNMRNRGHLAPAEDPKDKFDDEKASDSKDTGTEGEIEDASMPVENVDTMTPSPQPQPSAQKGCLDPNTAPGVGNVAFTPSDADPNADLTINPNSTQFGYVDYQDVAKVNANCSLTIFLHGAGNRANVAECYGSDPALDVLGQAGSHVLLPCYHSSYGVNNCGDEVGKCRLEAFEGVDHSPVISVAPQDALENRIIKSLQYLQGQNPAGNWKYFLTQQGGVEKPDWSKIIIAGSSHGASSAGLIAKFRQVKRVVMISGPLDANQSWLTAPGLTPADRHFAFSCKNDRQHQGHRQSFQDIKLPGQILDLDNNPISDLGQVKPHQVIIGGNCSHGNVGPRNISPKDQNNNYRYAPIWNYLFSGG